jgi:hypothetical protein
MSENKKVISKKDYLKQLRVAIKDQYGVDLSHFTDDMVVEFLNIDFTTVDWVK